MLDLESFSNAELLSIERQYETDALIARNRAAKCLNIRLYRDALMMQREANKAIERARNGTCTNGVGDCPVHQMGSCKELAWKDRVRG